MKRKRVKVEEWEVEAVTDSRLKLEYTVRWNDGSVTNEPLENVIPGSEEAVHEFHRLHPAKPNQDSERHIEHLSGHLNAVCSQNAALSNEVQMLKAHRLPDAIQAALFIPHQKLVLEENACLKAQLGQIQHRFHETESRAQHWQARAESFLTLNHQSQQLIALNQGLLADNVQLNAKLKAIAGSTHANPRQAPADQLNWALWRRELLRVKGGDQEPSTKDVAMHQIPGITQAATSKTFPQAHSPQQRQTGVGNASSAPAVAAVGLPIPQTSFNALAAAQCHHCYHEQSSCFYVAGEKCAACEKFGRKCKLVDRDQDRSFPLPRATVRQMQLREAKLQAMSDGGTVMGPANSRDGTSDHAPPEKPDAQLLEDQEDGDDTISFITVDSSASVPKQPTQDAPPPVDSTGRRKSRIDWAEEAKVRCHACYHHGYRCTYIPGQECYHCSPNGSNKNRTCKPVVTINGIAPMPACVQKAARRKERLSAAVTQVGSAAEETLSREELSHEVKALKAAQAATEDTWMKQISLLEEALSKYSAEGPDGPTGECRRCGSTESVGLGEVPGARRLLCHACDLQIAKQGKAAAHQHDHGLLLDDNRRLRAENIGLTTEVAALQERLIRAQDLLLLTDLPMFETGTG